MPSMQASPARHPKYPLHTPRQVVAAATGTIASAAMLLAPAALAAQEHMMLAEVSEIGKPAGFCNSRWVLQAVQHSVLVQVPALGS